MSSNKNVFLKRIDILRGVLDANLQPEKKRKMVDEYVSLHLGGIKEEDTAIVSALFREYQRRWQNAHRKKDSFLKANEMWLQECVVFERAAASSSKINLGGRPLKDFDSTCDRTKRRKTEVLRQSFTPAELKFAAGMALQAEGNRELAVFLKTGSNQPTCMPVEQALAIYVDARLTKRSYDIVRAPVKDYYPSYDKIAAAKSQCFPSFEHIELSETLCRVELQALLNHTCSRLITLVQPKIEQLVKEGQTLLRLLLKWGCDGSSGFNEYKQKFVDPGCSDAHIFLTSLVPLRLITDQQLIWDNPRSSSTRYCRPISLKFAKETVEVTKAEIERMHEEISNLNPFEIEVAGTKVVIGFELMLTMIDGKVVNAITDTKSSMRCYLCNATSSNFNYIDDMINRAIITDNLEYGMSSLHCWIRSFECLLHISFRLSFKKWIKTAHMSEYNSARERIQKEFYEQLGLHVDKPRARFGNSNDGT